MAKSDIHGENSLLSNFFIETLPLLSPLSNKDIGLIIFLVNLPFPVCLLSSTESSYFSLSVTLPVKMYWPNALDSSTSTFI